jgi:hypothetical protein
MAQTVTDYKPLRCQLCCQASIDDVLNYLESVNFIQCEKLRCESRHGNPYLIIHAGHLNPLSPERTLQLCYDRKCQGSIQMTAFWLN